MIDSIRTQKVSLGCTECRRVTNLVLHSPFSFKITVDKVDKEENNPRYVDV